MRVWIFYLWPLFAVIAAAWTYVDAGRRRQPGCLWFGVVLFLGLPGLLLYLALRPVLDAVDAHGERLRQLEQRQHRD